MFALLMWALLFHFGKYVMSSADAFLVGAIRYIGASILLLPILRYKKGYFFPTFNPKQWGLIIAVGVVGIFLYNVVFFNAEKVNSGAFVAIIFSLTPCLTTLISSVVFKQKLKVLTIIGIIIAFIGTLGIIGYSTPSCDAFFCSSIFTSGAIKAELLALATCVVFSIYSVMNKFATKEGLTSLELNTYASIVGAICLSGFAFVHSDLSQITFYPLSFWATMLYVVVLATVVAYLFYTDALHHLGVFKTTVFQNTIPFQVVILGAVFFHESITLAEVGCGCIILFGVFITNISLKTKHIVKK